jgi:hypothetical protein
MESFSADPLDFRIEGILGAAGVKTRKTISVVACETHTVADPRWDEGSCTRTATYRCPHKGRLEDGSVITLGEESVVVTHGTFRGKPAMVTLYVHPVLFASLKPSKPAIELTPDQNRVLAATAHYNSSGRARWRADNRMSKDEWSAVVAELCALKLVRKNGAILPAGRNAADKDLSL